MSSEMADRDQRSPRGRKRVPSVRRTSAAAPNLDGWVLLGSSGWYVRLIDVLDHATTGQLASEDACWSFARDDWRERRPRWWHRAERAAWNAEGQRLEDKRERLVEQTRQVHTLRPAAGRGRRRGARAHPAEHRAPVW